jgi:pimeloyl-ACP methyl ester carboxylesterase
MDTGSIHVTRWGTSGPRVVLVHGGAQGTPHGGERNFSGQKALADRGFRLVIPDRPGHGRSPDPGRPDDAEADGAWVADLLEDAAHLVGHSFGGVVALAAAAKRPAAVRSLTMIEPAAHKLATSDPHVRRLALRMLAAALFSMSDASRAKRIMGLLGIPAELYAQASPADRARLGRSVRRIRIPSRATLERQLGEIKAAGIPLLVVTGGWNPAFEASSDAVARVGGGRRAVIKSPHHFPQWFSDDFNPTLVRFMEESDSKRT